MGLSYSSVEKAYKVFNEIKKTILPDLRIPSFPEDMGEWTEKERENPRVNVVYGWDRKSDSGWENIYFITENPSDELKSKFEELKDMVPNSSMSHAYRKNKSLWIFGWF